MTKFPQDSHRFSMEPPSFDRSGRSEGLRLEHGTAGHSGRTAYFRETFDLRWPDLPAPIMARPAPPEPYPTDAFPIDLAEVLAAVQRLADCPAPIAGAALLGALALLAQHDFRVQTLAPHPSPASLYLVPIAESGLHKSATLRLAGQGHQDSDQRVVARWERVNEEARERSDDQPRPRPSTPAALLSDFTADGLLRQLLEGRPSVAIWTTEAGTQMNASFSKSQGARTVSYLNAAWDSETLSKIRVGPGNHIYLPGGTYHVSLVWAGQPDLIQCLMFGDLTVNGLLARCLISRDDDYPDLGVPLDGDEGLIRAFNSQVLRVRDLQDRGMEYARTGGELGQPLPIIRLSTEARNLLGECYQEQRSLAHRLGKAGQRHEAAFAQRVPEHGARIAAVFTGWETYLAGGPPSETLLSEAVTIERAIHLVRWYQGEVTRLAAASGATLKASCARHLVSVIARVMADPASSKGRYPLLTGSGLAVNTVANNRGRPEIRSNPDFRQQVINLLVDLGYLLRSKSRGRYLVHPRLAEAAKAF